ncbi:MAG: hydroxymethylbilane synthase [Planctomycetes bacterium]|nr:hydroxymethylbilane synthase [Planctomycetota bacterium]
MRAGTRGSPLALWQARWVIDLIRERSPGARIEIVEIRTRAEEVPDRSIAEIGAAVFTRELDEALIDGRIDLAVHSLKDIPSALPEQLALAAVPPRESPLDAYVSWDGVPLERLPAGSRVGTGSPRRKAQILALRPDLQIVPLRGNLETRLRKIREQDLCGTLLALAGLRRMGREDAVTQILEPDVVLPAVGQGAVAVCTRRDDAVLLERLRPLEHRPTRLAVEAERSFLAELRGGCQVPAGALASVEGADLRIDGVVAAPDGSSLVRGTRRGAAESGRELGRGLALEILERGGREILSLLRGS